MIEINKKRIKIFADGANLDSIDNLSKNPLIDGITTNPTLMKKSGVTNYLLFSKSAFIASKGKSLSIEVLSNSTEGMIKEAKVLSSIGNTIYVKIPIVNIKGDSTSKVISKLCKENIKLNITAVLSNEQIDMCAKSLEMNATAYISIFAGRIADTGRDPIPFMEYAIQKFSNYKNVEILWASTREVFNIYQAASCNTDIITITPELFNKLSLRNYDLKKLSVETVKMFYSDSLLANYSILPDN